MVRRWLAICLGVWVAAGVAAPAALRAQPAPPVTGLPVATQDPVPGYSLPTDGLMAPAPAVPPRSSYRQPPASDPADPPRTPEPDYTVPEGTVIPLPGGGGGRFVRYVPRYGRSLSPSGEKLPDGTQRFVITGGVIVYVSPGVNQPEIEFATDDAVVWVRGQEVGNPAAGFEVGGEQKREVEVYLTGNVIVRTVAQSGSEPLTQTLRADQVYYDVTRNRAVALAADLEISSPRVADGIHMTGREIDRLDQEHWEILKGSAFSSKLPADPGLRIDSPRSSLRSRRVARRNIFGLPYRDFQGRPVEGWEHILTVRHSVTRVNEVPVFYWPWLRTDLTEPLGPLTGIGGGQDRIFGTQVYTTWDMYKVIAVTPPPGHKWLLHLDYLSDRGPAAGTDYFYSVPNRQTADFPNLPLPPSGTGFVRLYGINDGGVDVIGSGRGPEPDHPQTRGRVQWQHMQELTDGMYFQGQLAYLSDKNFLEQYYKQEFDVGPNQETFAYLTYQHENLWASGLFMPKLGRQWETQTEWLPKLDGAVVGQNVLDLFLYNARASAGYGLLRPSQINPLPIQVTEQRTDTGRFDFGQELSLPFDLGPFKVVPYGTLDLTYYTRDLLGDDQGRVYGGGGVRGSLPFSKLYEDAASELFNVRGLYHKAVLGANYSYMRSNVPYYNLPQLDQLNDDNTQRTYQNARPYQPQFYPGPTGVALATSPLYDPQLLAIRRLVGDRVDTLDNMQVLQVDLRQRFQTKRGYPGLEHTADFFTLALSGSYFPEMYRDNFGHPFGQLQYNSLWNVGDRVSVLSAGWLDPFDLGTRYWNLGVSLDRPDRTNFYLGYRQTDPLNSKQVTASVGYQLSRRYSTSLGVSYDFGIQEALTNSLSLTRTGSDMTVSIGFTYNALVNNFGFQFLIVPNLLNTFAPNAVRAFTPGQR